MPSEARPAGSTNAEPEIRSLVLELIRSKQAQSPAKGMTDVCAEKPIVIGLSGNSKTRYSQGRVSRVSGVDTYIERAGQLPAERPRDRVGHRSRKYSGAAAHSMGIRYAQSSPLKPIR